MADIVICDEFVNKTGTWIAEETKKMETALDIYLNIMQDISATGIIEGDTAEALKLFISTAEILKGKFSNMGQCTEQACKNFISKVDDADQYLY